MSLMAGRRRGTNTLCRELRAAVCDQDFANLAYLGPQVVQVAQGKMGKMTKIAPPPPPLQALLYTSSATFRMEKPTMQMGFNSTTAPTTCAAASTAWGYNVFLC